MPVQGNQDGSTKRSSVSLAVGPMWTRGDAVKSDPSSTIKARNCALVRGVVEKRYPFTRDKQFGGAISSAYGSPGHLFRYRSSTTELLIVGTDQNSIANDYTRSNNQLSVRTAAATYTAIRGASLLDATNFNDKIWAIGRGNSSFFMLNSTVSYDGTTTDLYPFQTILTGRTICSFNGRLVIGSPTGLNAAASSYAFDVGATWTVGGAWSQPVKDANNFVVATIANATTDTIKSTAAFFTPTLSGSGDLYATITFWLQPISATVSTPITITIENSGGTTVYASGEFTIPDASTDGAWRSYSVTARVADGTALYPKLKIGNTSGGGTVGVTFRLSNYPAVSDTSFYGALANYGHLAMDVPPGYGTPTYGVTPYWNRINRVLWSEALDPTDWRATNYLDFTDVDGEVVAIRPVGGRLVVYKNNGVLTARGGPSADAAIVREGFFSGVGTTGPKAVATFDNIQFFVGASQVYAISESDPPTPIISDGMRDEMFDATNLVAFPSIAVDEAKRTLWIHTQKYKIYIYSLDDQKIVGYYQMTDGEGSETPFTPYGDIFDMEYFNGKVWVLVLETGVVVSGTDKIDLVYLDSASTQDAIDGTSRNVVCEYVFHPLETGRPRNQVTVQTIGLDHRVTASQSGSTTRYSVSLDNGNTWTKYNDVTLTPLSAGAAADTQIMRVPVHQTSPRLVLKIQHTGLAGPSYFNLTGGQADILVRGREVQATNPTAVTSNL